MKIYYLTQESMWIIVCKQVPNKNVRLLSRRCDSGVILISTTPNAKKTNNKKNTKRGRADGAGERQGPHDGTE